MPKFILSLAILALLANTTAGGGDDKVAAFMQAKLTHSQKVLAAIALEDYAGMAKHSQELSILSLAAQWQVIQTEDYKKHSEDFRRAAGSLTKAAKNKNLNDAILAYMSVTLSCVNCHKYVRSVRAAYEPRDYGPLLR